MKYRARTFNTAADFIAFVREKAGLEPLGQHDAHVKALDRWLQRAWLDRAEAAVMAEVEKINAETRARNGAAHQDELLQAAE